MTLPQPSLLIRADASPAIGAGHVMRCLALAKAWQRSGGAVQCLLAEGIPEIEERLAREQVIVKKISAVPGSAADAELTKSEALCAPSAWLVVDGYRFGPDYVHSLKVAGLRVLFLDDDGRFDFYSADIVLNQNLSASSSMYNRMDPSTRLLLGSQYVLLRPEFSAESKIREIPPQAQKILVTMGGSDPDNLTRKVLLALLRMKVKLEVKIVIGSGNPWQSELCDLAAHRAEFQLERNPANMAALFRWADLAISGAGGTVWELAYLGVPAIVIVGSSDQRQIARGLEENHVAISLGDHANLSEERIAATLQNLIGDAERRRAMSERGRKLVDGNGADRVVTFLRNSL